MYIQHQNSLSAQSAAKDSCLQFVYSTSPGQQLPAETMDKDSEYSNQLSNETSPYLLQHAHNPVDWYPWGPEALEKARRENKPILLSVGYSACHWCHVMAHESFEDPETAELMNRLFVNIKVDREERPDLDKIYQTAHSLLTRRPGGASAVNVLSGRYCRGTDVLPAQHWC